MKNHCSSQLQRNVSTYDMRRSVPYEKLHRILDASLDLICVIDKAGRFVLLLSNACESILGYTKDELVGRSFKEFIVPEDVETTCQIAKAILQGKKVNSFENRYYRKDGGIADLMWSAKFDSYEGVMHCVARDITDKKKWEDQFRNAALVAKQTSDPVVVTDVDRKINWINEAFTRTYGYALTELLGKDLQEILSGPDTCKTKLASLQRMAHRRKPFASEIVYYSKDGKKIFADFHVQPLYNDHGALTGFFSIHHDITEKKALESRLKLEQQERERKIAEAVIQVQEKERSEIARELHDNVNQLLSTIKLYLEVLRNDKNAAPDILPKAIQLTLTAIEEIRCISHTLSYVSIKNTTLKEALSVFVDDINMAGKTMVSLDMSLNEQQICEGVKLSIYRIVQEQVNNILKYARASSATVEVLQCEKNISLKIVDNGIGFDPCRKRTGIGLMNIENRAIAYSGTYEVRSAPGKGCFLLVKFPIKK